MTLREWLADAATKNYPLVHEYGVRQTATDALRRTDRAHLDSPVRLIPLDELYRAEGKRGVIAETEAGARWVRLEPHPDNA